MSEHQASISPNRKVSAKMVWPCKQNTTQKAFQATYMWE